jgi:hypothetical protein
MPPVGLFGPGTCGMVGAGTGVPPGVGAGLNPLGRSGFDGGMFTEPSGLK